MSYKSAGFRSPSEAVAELLEQAARQLHTAGFSGTLRPTQWAVLRFLARANPTACTLTAFASFHGVTRSSAAQSIRLLIRKKLVRYERSTTDRRVRYLSLTAQGIAVLQTDRLREIQGAIEACPPEAVEGFVTVLSEVTRRLLKRRATPFEPEDRGAETGAPDGG